MPGTINKKSINKKILNNRNVRNTVFRTLERKVNTEKELFNKEFISHPVTKEIDSGPSSVNMSGTLGGYGNLFSFIGFSNGSNPTASIKKLIQKIILQKNVRVLKNSFQLKVNIPSKEDFAEISRSPWEKGRSWLFDMERGISGLGAYLYGRFEKSRSGSGIQSQYNYSNKRFRNVKYFSSMYNKFIKRLGVK